MRSRETVNAYRTLVNGILGLVPPEDAAKIKQRPLYIQLMSDGAPASVVRIVRPAHEGEQASRDYDFSDIAIQSHEREGYTVTKQALGRL